MSSGARRGLARDLLSIARLDHDPRRDCVELQREVERLRALNAELEVRARERMEALELFSYSVAHDLRAPLRAIHGFASAVLEDHGATLDEEVKHHLSRIVAGGTRMGALIDALLSLSRVTRASVSREPLDLAELAEPIIADLRRGEPERQVEVRISRPLLVRGDPRLVRLLLRQLLDNAWKFSRVRASALVELRGEGDAFTIRDNGVGFDMQYAKTLFAPFQRLHLERDFPGLGIGLAIAAHVCRRHDGKIWVDAAPDAGASFTFTLSDLEKEL